MLAATVHMSKPERSHEHLVVDRSVGQSISFRLRQRRNPVMEVRDEHAALFIFHSSQQLRQHHGGIGSPISIMPAVQAVMRSVNRDLQVSIASRTKYNGLLATLIHGAITDEPNIAVDQIAIGIEDLFQMR